MSRKDRVGQRFGKLVVVGRLPEKTKNGQIVYECICDCGNTVNVVSSNLGYRTRACGCLLRTSGVDRAYKHGACRGGKGNRLYALWCSMRYRCTKENHICYKSHGNLGISVCDEWQSFAAFQKWALQAGYTDSALIARKNKRGNFTPDNCVWVESARTGARIGRKNVAWNGETHSLKKWADILGISYNTLWVRVNRNGFTIEQAFTTPVRPYTQLEEKQ